jgi:hypothetical protein
MPQAIDDISISTTQAEAERLHRRSLEVAAEAEREPPGPGRDGLIQLSILYHRAARDIRRGLRSTILGRTLAELARSVDQ